MKSHTIQKLEFAPQTKLNATRVGPGRFRPGWIFAWILAGAWILPLVYAFWAAFRPAKDAARFLHLSPLTLDNFRTALLYAPFARYMVNTIILVVGLLAIQMILCTLAGFAFARIKFYGSSVAFALILIQLMIVPEVLIVENYHTMARLGLVDSITAIALPYMGSAFGIFLLRQTFKTVPRELEDAARIDGCGWLRTLWHIHIPLSKSAYTAFGLVSVSHHWNNFLWPMVITSSRDTRPLTVGLAIFAAPESGVNWAVLSAGTLISIAPLLLLFLIFQHHFIESFIQSGIK
ncbi:MAG: carbohydrate ABC transporter permease [Spirochaeta sp.]